MKKISILTICPEYFDSFLKSHVIDLAVRRGLLEIEIVDIRDYAAGSFRRVDDSPYGGGRGLLLRCEPVLDALEAVLADSSQGMRSRTVALAPAGHCLTQQKVHDYAENTDHLVLICGHYEGMDARIYGHVDERLSIGPYVLSGGEIAAQVVADAVARLLPGNLKEGSAGEESYEAEGLLEYLQYTRPADYRGERVPEVLLSGDHAKIAAWRRESARSETAAFRADK